MNTCPFCNSTLLYPPGAVKLVLPHPPSVNHYWRHFRGHTVISRDGRAYRDSVWAILRQHRIRRLDGRLAVGTLWSPPDKRRRDIDNIGKALFDALAFGGLYADDEQIDRTATARVEPCNGGKVELIAYSI